MANAAAWPPTATRPPGRLPAVARQFVVFGAIGVVSTGAYIVLYAALRSIAGPAFSNAVALLVTAVGNTAANRRFTFGLRGHGTLRDQAAGLAALLVALAITTPAVGILGLLLPNASRLLEVAVLVAANGCATACRFILLRAWIAPASALSSRTGVAQ